MPLFGTKFSFTSEHTYLVLLFGNYHFDANVIHCYSQTDFVFASSSLDKLIYSYLYLCLLEN